MTAMETCQQCKQPFEITEEDRGLLTLLEVPEPTFCPTCRLIRRSVWRNERALYKRPCGLCKQDKILVYSPENPHVAFCYPCWWSDNWSGETFARDYDFSRPFFEQFKELLLAVPRPGIIKQGFSTNSEYTNRVTDMKNCYLVFATTSAENCRYSTWVMSSQECLDCYNTQKSEQCYECIDCLQCYQVAFSQESNSCSNSRFLFNCTNCQDCFGCVNLKNKQYCIFNKQYTPEEYKKKIAEMNLGDAQVFERVQAEFEEFKKQFVVPAMVTRQGVRVSGNWIDKCQDTTRSFTCRNTQNVRYGLSLFDTKDSMDYNHWGATAERIYDAENCGIQVAGLKFANECWQQLIDSEYVMNCHGSSNLFGCIGIKKGQYMILNKQYSKEEYQTMVAKIKKQMDEVPYVDKQGKVYRYGEFYPAELSPFAYNETIAHDYFPVSKQMALAQGFVWRDEQARSHKIAVSGAKLPVSAALASDSLSQEVIGCEHAGACDHQCTSAFRILPEDLALYKRANLPLPRTCPNCRHFARVSKRNPFKLYSRSCQCAGKTAEGLPAPGGEVYQNNAPHEHGDAQCGNAFETSYAPERPEKVYCVSCYQAEVA